MTYDSWKEDAFNMYTNNGMVQFKRNNAGLYTYKQNEGYKFKKLRKEQDVQPGDNGQ